MSGGRVAMLVSSLAVVLVACGGNSGTAATSAPATTAAASTSAAGSTTTLASASTSTGATSTTLAPTKTILQLITDDGHFTKLVSLLQAAGLTDTLSGAGPVTLIAPTDSAFAKMDVATLDKFAQNPAALKMILQYHLIDALLSKADITHGSVKTIEGMSLTLQPTTGLPIINGSKAIKGARATNGVVLAMDTPLIPIDFTLP